MKKNILIIGGGISGLSCLHFLKTKNPRADVCLLERELMVGGTVHSVPHNHFIFEHGPNGVIANQPLTIKLFSDLGLDDQLIEAEQSSKKRYILKNHRLNFVPSNPFGLMKSGYLTLPEMLRAFGEIFFGLNVRAQRAVRLQDNETVYDFAARRFGSAVAEKLFDPLIKGIYGGNARRLHMRSAFPKIACLEQECGSVIRGMIRRKRENKNRDAQKLLSFRGGMQTVTDALFSRYADNIRCGVNVLSVQKKDLGFTVETSSGMIEADHIILCVPAYAAAKLLNQNCHPSESWDPVSFDQFKKDLTAQDAGSSTTFGSPRHEGTKAFEDDSLLIISKLLNRIEYAPIAVVGMVFSKKDWVCPIEGYGYLVSSSQQTPVLGVLFEDQVFSREKNCEQMLVRVMVGGSDFPDVVRDSPEKIQLIAQEHLRKVLGITASPETVLMKVWPRAIPQYTVEYSRMKTDVMAKLAGHPRLYLLANYLNGVSFNDCVENAYALAQRF